MIGSWRIQMFGPLRLVGEGGVVTRFRTRRVALLLAQLALFRNREHYRDEVGDRLWPEVDDAVLRRNLRQALSSLRHVLEPPPVGFGTVLQAEQERLRLNPDLVSTDVAEFEAAVANARRSGGDAQRRELTRAVSLYTGDLLIDFQEDWILQERLRLEDLYLFSLRGLVEHCRAAGDLDEAIRYLEIAVEREPYSEDAAIRLMSAQMEAGRASDAVREFDRLRHELGEHFGEEPGSAARAIWQKAKALNATGTAARVSREPSEEPEPALPQPLPPQPPQSQQTVSLPVQLTRLCGREEEIDRTVDHFVRRKAALVTIVGPAGMGKTRLSVEAARRLAETHPWNVRFLGLADLVSGPMVMDAVLDAFNARRSGRPDPLERLQEAVGAEGNELLVLDNAEHLIEDVAEIASQLMARVSGLKLLVTSRQPLRLAGEHLVGLHPLPVPNMGTGSQHVTAEEVAELARSAGVQLFVDRCQMVRPDFQLTTRNARAVAAICARLDGMPLAIELAAGLSGSFSPAQMAVQLQSRLTQIASRRRDLPHRHRSLRAAIDYSVETLPHHLQLLFAQLSVFRGGFTPEAAAAVCSVDGDIASDLWELTERSLLRVESSDDDPDLRYRLFESFREYGEEQLDSEDLVALRYRHAAYYQSLPSALGTPSSFEERTMWHHRMETEFDNFIAALNFRYVSDDFEACIALLGGLSGTWSSRGPRTIERSFIRRLAENASGESIAPEARILLLRMLGTTYIRTAEYASAYEACRAALAAAEAAQMPNQVVICKLGMATCAGYLGNLEECLELGEWALKVLPEEDLVLRGRAWLGVGAVRWGQGRIPEAQTAFFAAAQLSARARGGEADVLILNNLARVSLDLGHFEEAMVRLGEVMRICERLNDEFGRAISLSLVGRYHWLRGQVAAALANGKEAILKFREMDFLHYSLVSIFQHALAVVDSGEWEAGASLLAATHGIGKQARLPDLQDHDRAVASIRKHLSESAFERAWARGLAMSTEEAFRLALKFG
jgi:predicted ATPase/DNA-binding SARP family transcriptional activator